jgi:hypothetical protein
VQRACTSYELDQQAIVQSTTARRRKVNVKRFLRHQECSCCHRRLCDGARAAGSLSTCNCIRGPSRSRGTRTARRAGTRRSGTCPCTRCWPPPRPGRTAPPGWSPRTARPTGSPPTPPPRGEPPKLQQKPPRGSDMAASYIDRHDHAITSLLFARARRTRPYYRQ